METGTNRVKRGMAEMQKGGVIMDVMNAEQAKIAEAAGAAFKQSSECRNAVFNRGRDQNGIYRNPFSKHRQAYTGTI